MGVEANNARHLRTEEELKRSITDLIDEAQGITATDGEEYRANNYWYWEPRHLFERMRVQQSLFIFGHATQNEWGTAPFHLDPSTKRYRETGDDSIVISDDPVLIAISPRLKADMEDGQGNRSYWRELFGYDARSLFPDLEGFSSYHGAQQEFEKTFFIR